MMNHFPDFEQYGYQVTEELGCNRQGGRKTYKAFSLHNNQQVVIKQFQFVSPDSNWSSFKAHEREIKVLKSLNYPTIPRYLDVFETAKGFCLVQAYLDARSLATSHYFATNEIKQIAVSLLKILVYLQDKTPPVFHRDIKPENILIDERLNVYLVDFGFARIDDSSVAMSSAIVGTFGFMPPEQLRDRKLTKASDLYSLGTTLICLITGTKSTEINKLFDLDSNRLNFKHLVSEFDLLFIQWLEKMVEPDPKNRFADAKTALKALQPLNLERLPEVRLDCSSLDLKATKLGELLTQTITITNPIEETILEGSWEVAPHSSDPPHTPDNHAWISLQPKTFKKNSIQCKSVRCKISVDTSSLMADKIYERWLLLKTNSLPETYTIKLKVQTAPIPIETKNLPYKLIALLLVASFMGTTLVQGVTLILFKDLFANLWKVALAVDFGGILVALIFGGSSGVMVGVVLGVLVGFVLMIIFDPEGNDGAIANIGAFLGGWFGFGTGIILFLAFMERYLIEPQISQFTLVKAGIALMGAILLGLIAIVGVASKEDWHKGISKKLATILSRLTIGLGISLAIALAVGFSNPYIIFAITATGIPLATMIFYVPLKQRQLIARYRQQEQNQILP